MGSELSNVNIRDAHASAVIYRKTVMARFKFFSCVPKRELHITVRILAFLTVSAHKVATYSTTHI